MQPSILIFSFPNISVWVLLRRLLSNISSLFLKILEDCFYVRRFLHSVAEDAKMFQSETKCLQEQSLSECEGIVPDLLRTVDSDTNYHMRLCEIQTKGFCALLFQYFVCNLIRQEMENIEKILYLNKHDPAEKNKMDFLNNSSKNVLKVTFDYIMHLS